MKVNVENFLLHISLVANENGNGVPVAYSFLKSATIKNLDFFYQCLSGKKFLQDDTVEILETQLANWCPIVNMIDKLT